MIKKQYLQSIRHIYERICLEKPGVLMKTKQKHMHLKRRVIAVCIPVLYLLMSSAGRHVHLPGYHISGTIKGIDSGRLVIYSYHPQDRTTIPVDSAIIHEGRFELSGNIDSVQMVGVSVYPGNWSFDFFLDNRDLCLNIDTTGSQYYDYTAFGRGKGAFITRMRESGSPDYDAIEHYRNSPEQKKYDPVIDSLGRLIDEEKKNMDVNYHYRAQLDSVAGIVNTIKIRQLKEYIKANAGAVAGSYLLYRYYLPNHDMDAGELAGFLGLFSGAARQSKYYKYLFDKLQQKKAIAIGRPGPDFTLLQRDSTAFTLSSVRGQYIMLDFWASWCHPCRAAIPHWKEIYQKYHEKGFQIVSISDDNKWSNWKKALDTEKMPWIQVCDEFPVKNMPARVGSLYMSPYLPFYVLLDKEGKILVYSGDEKDIDHKLEALLGT